MALMARIVCAVSRHSASWPLQLLAFLLAGTAELRAGLEVAASHLREAASTGFIGDRRPILRELGTPTHIGDNGMASR